MATVAINELDRKIPAPEVNTENPDDSSTKSFDEMDHEQKLQALNTYSEIVQINGRKEYLTKKIVEHKEMADKMRSSLFKEQDTDFIDEKVTSFINTHPGDRNLKKTFMDYIKNPVNLNYFYTDPATGEMLDIDISNAPNKKATNADFKMDFLLFIFSTIESSMKIDAEMAAYEEELKKFDVEYKDIMRMLSDNVLLYIDNLEAKLDPDDLNYKKTVREIKHIRAGYDMSMFKNVLEKYPSVIEKCVTEMKKPKEIESISARYHQKLMKADVNVSLVTLIDDDPKKSMEYLTLPKGYYEEGRENLFVWSLIRFFAMESWSDGAMRKLHASVFNVLSKLRRGDMEPELKEYVVDNIRDYLTLFQNYKGI